MNVLTLTSLFPGSAAPRHGVFVRERMRDYREHSGDSVRVVAPVPWFPRALPTRRYAAFQATPAREEFGGFTIEHPRYAMIPKLGVPLQGLTYELGVRSCVRRHVFAGECDVLDAHYAYPDGFAAGLLKQRLRVPMVLTVRGTDVNWMPQVRGLRSQVRFALQAADHVVAVSRALADLAIEAGADATRVTVLRNGVDATTFRPLDRAECRGRLGLPDDRRVVVSVGFLVERKGHDLALRALARIPAATRPLLLIAGDGPQEASLRRLIAELGLEHHARLLGAVAHDELAAVYSAGDLSLLASAREGWPNVLLEAMACGTPVLATAVHGSVEVVKDDTLGHLLVERNEAALAAALVRALEARFDRDHVRRYAESMSWRETSKGLAAVFHSVVKR